MKLETVKKRLKGFGKIENMYSPRYNGGKVANQFIITFDNGCVFQSYESIIAIELYNSGNKKVYLTNKWDYSKTTGIYRNQFLSETINETREKIKTGEYKILQ